MRIPSGVVDQGFFFVAVDASDYVTRETGLSSFTVVRSRNGAADVTMTTPTVTEVDNTTMPGVYFLLCDEDMTLAAGNQSEAMAYHITHAGMAPVTQQIEIYRPSVTAGETLNVSSGALNAIADGLLTSAKFAAGAFDAVWSVTARLLTAGTNIVLAKGTGVTGFNDLSAAQVNAEVDTAIADAALATAAAVATVDSEIGTLQSTANAIEADTQDIQSTLAGLNDPTAAAIADAVWTEAISDHSGVSGSTAEALNAAGSAGDPWTTALPGAYGAGSAGKIIGDNINATISSRASQTSVDDVPTNSELTAALADLPTNAEIAAALGDLPTAAENATELLDQANGVESGLTFREWLRLSAAALFGKASGMATTTAVFRDTTDTTDRIVATVDESGNRSAVTLDPS